MHTVTLVLFVRAAVFLYTASLSWTFPVPGVQVMSGSVVGFGVAHMQNVPAGQPRSDDAAAAGG